MPNNIPKNPKLEQGGGYLKNFTLYFQALLSNSRIENEHYTISALQYLIKNLNNQKEQEEKFPNQFTERGVEATNRISEIEQELQTIRKSLLFALINPKKWK